MSLDIDIILYMSQKKLKSRITGNCPIGVSTGQIPIGIFTGLSLVETFIGVSTGTN